MNTFFYILAINLIALIPAIIGFGFVSLFISANKKLFNLYFLIGYLIIALVIILIFVYSHRKKTISRITYLFKSISVLDLIFAFIWGIIFSSIVLFLYPISSKRNIVDFLFIAFILFIFVANGRDSIKKFLKKRNKRIN
ncbi:hypothetical protein BMS3Abin04_03010 [bacterium BMS3Abin04]|nr:hypothetical protein BMS3Abin04_03010 [bacterium BMS3Abin04]